MKKKKEFMRWCFKWAVLHPGHGHVISVHERKSEAVAWKRAHAAAYKVAEVYIVPLEDLGKVMVWPPPCAK